MTLKARLIRMGFRPEEVDAALAHCGADADINRVTQHIAMCQIRTALKLAGYTERGGQWEPEGM